MTTESGIILYDEVNVNIRYAYDIRCEVVCESGTISLGDQNVTELRSTAGASHKLCRDHNDRFHFAFNQELQQWINAVAHGEHTGSTAWDGYAAASVCDAALKALASGTTEPVTLIAKPTLYA
jgi:myo-inositol 2-dehydrogenase/D-chiro-inositol 1-dehydrogenase